MARALKSTKPKEVGGRFRIVVGDHLGDGPPGCECDGCLKSEGKNHRYSQRRQGDPPDYDNDVIDSAVDLERRHNSKDSVKFLRLHENEVRQVDHDAARQRIADLERELAELRAGKSETATVAANSVADNLDTMTVAELKAFAAEEEIDLRGASRREEILRILRESK